MRLFPTFAEYTKKEARQTVDGLMDTGPTLRAFLPFRDEQERFTIQNYQGIAALVDTRVMCVRPHLTNITLHTHNTGRRLTANMSVPAELRSRPADLRGRKLSWRLEIPNDSTPDIFLNCSIAAPKLWSSFLLAYYHEDDWRIGLCRFDSYPNPRIHLMPESIDMDRRTYPLPSATWWPYVAINTSTSYNRTNFSEENGPEFFKPESAFNDGEWLRLYLERNQTHWEQAGNYLNGKVEYNVNVSMCFPSLYATASSTNAQSFNNRTEPVPGPLSDNLRLLEVRRQLGQFDNDPDKRGLLELSEQD